MDVREKLVELFYDNNVWCDQNIEGLADDVMDIIAHGVTVQEWISVDDVLPENGQEVFVAYVFPFQNSLISKHFYSASIYHIDDGNGFVNRPHFENEGFHGMRVTHWMPLPPLPKGE